MIVLRTWTVIYLPAVLCGVFPVLLGKLAWADARIRIFATFVARRPRSSKFIRSTASDEPSEYGREKGNERHVQIPDRFIRATKGDIEAARQRYWDTLEWRAKHGIDNICHEPVPHFSTIKRHYPHYHHLRGKNMEPCYYEFPPKIDLKALRNAGLTLEELLRYYAMVCEFTWKYIEPSEEGKSIYVIDLSGIRPFDFVGDVVDFTLRASKFTAAHYPERLGTMFVVNVPSWFHLIWKVVRPVCSKETRKKITILRAGDTERILKALEEKIDKENIPPEYGGESMPLGESPEEKMFVSLVETINAANSSNTSSRARDFGDLITD